MEPRARAGRHKNSLNFPEELKSLLYGSGVPVHPDALKTHQHDDSAAYLHHPPTRNTTHPPTPYARITNSGSIQSVEPFPETLRVLDEIVTDFIIETCHAAYGVAWHSKRQKLKLADFEWVMRKDRTKLGRVQEMFRKKRFIDDKKRLIDEGAAGEKMQVSQLQDLGDVAGEEGTGKGKGRGRGRRKRKERDGEAVLAAGTGAGAAGAADAQGDEDQDLHQSKKARSSVGDD